ncbi:hypothetical protein Tco_1382435, partial [Tanacetum coccineum]
MTIHVLLAIKESNTGPPVRISYEAYYDEEGVITDFNNLPTENEVSPTPTLRIHNIHPKSQILGDPKSAVQTRSKLQQKSGEEPKKISEALQDESWVQAVQEDLLQFKLQQTLEEEEPEDQGRKSQDDPLVSLVQGLVTPFKTNVNASGEEQVKDISPTTLEAAKTLS